MLQWLQFRRILGCPSDNGTRRSNSLPSPIWVCETFKVVLSSIMPHANGSAMRPRLSQDAMLTYGLPKIQILCHLPNDVVESKFRGFRYAGAGSISVAVQRAVAQRLQLSIYTRDAELHLS